MSKDYVIITGANRGIGLALAKELSQSKSTVLISVQRSESAKELQEFVDERGVKLEIVRADLSDIAALESVVVDGVLTLLDKNDARSVTLIQNAGLAFTAKCGEQDIAKLIQLLNVNTVAPSIITELFVRHVQSWPIDKRLLFLSSGAAWKVYEVCWDDV
jgi:short-subunit dehydrogenase